MKEVKNISHCKNGDCFSIIFTHHYFRTMHRSTRFLVIFIALFLSGNIAAAQKNKQNKTITPGEVWLDVDGAPLNVHGGGILFHKGTYYWYGEVKKGNTWKVPGSNWENYRVKAGGVSCYSSKDLLNWKFEGMALASTKDSSSKLFEERVIERPKVVYNPATKKFVMWVHLDSENYAAAESGVAVSNTPAGPFTFVKGARPNGNMARDMTIFQDEDGKAYHFYSSEENATMYITQLSDDYLSHTKNEKRILIKQMREAPAVFKYNNKYYLISSGCTGWSPNAASYAVSDSIMGNWKEFSNPCQGPDADKTFYAQSTYVLPVDAKKGKFIFLADKWNKLDLENSRYIWLPLTMADNAKPVIEWQDKWTPQLKGKK